LAEAQMAFQKMVPEVQELFTTV